MQKAGKKIRVSKIHANSMNRIAFYLNRSHIKNDGTCAVYLITYCKGKQVKINTGVCVDIDDWDFEKNVITGKSTDVKNDNLIIMNCHARLTRIFVKYKLNFKELTPDLIIKEYENPTIDLDFYAYWEAEMKSRKDFVAPGTHAQHESVLAKLKKFKPELSFSELTPEFLRDFKRHCKSKEIGNSDNTIAKNLMVIKVYIRHAVMQRKLERSPFEVEKIKRTKPDIVYLEPKELKKFIEKYRSSILDARYQGILRIYLFSCFTGLRISDLKSITFDNIVGNTLVFKPVKTKRDNKIVRVPLTQAAISLYTDTGRSEGLIFITPAEQTMNKFLKEVAGKCGIKKKLSFHSARHTFATMYYRMTHDIVGLQKLMGHEDIDQTMVYTHIIVSDIENNMLGFDKVWH